MESFGAEKEPLGLSHWGPGGGHEESQVGWLCPQELTKEKEGRKAVGLDS